MIIAVGFRVRSRNGVIFRQWAAERIQEYIVKGFTMDDARLKQNNEKELSNLNSFSIVAGAGLSRCEHRGAERRCRHQATGRAGYFGAKRENTEPTHERGKKVLVSSSEREGGERS